MTLQEAIKAALQHPSPATDVVRPNSISSLAFREGEPLTGRIFMLEEIDATDWEVFDLYAALNR